MKHAIGLLVFGAVVCLAALASAQSTQTTGYVCASRYVPINGPAGRYGPFTTPFWGVWNFSKNQSAAKSLLTALSQADAIEAMVKASAGFDIPAFANLTTLKVWQEEGPPKGTLYHYSNPFNHQILSIAASPAPHRIAVQIYRHGLQTQMVVRYAIRNEPMDKVLAFANNELEGYMRV